MLARCADPSTAFEIRQIVAVSFLTWLSKIGTKLQASAVSGPAIRT
jgi:hypothetical protein